MTSYFFDLYPRTNPLGTVIARLTQLQAAKYRGEANGAGVGLIGLRGDTDDGQLIDPLGLQYVRVVEDDETVVGGFFLDNGDFDAINEQNTRLLTFTGAGALSYLDREVMWAYTYHPTIGADDPFDRQWRLYAQGFGAGDFLGNSFYRALFEAKGYNGAPGYRTVTPRNGEKFETAIPAITIGFDGFEDSDGNPWTLPSGDMVVGVGETLYRVAQKHMQAGLYIEVDPHTFECRAWEAANHRRDRTGASFGADVVRFSKGQNIKSDASRALAPFIRRTEILSVGSDDTASTATFSGDVPWHGSILPDLTDLDAIHQLAVSEGNRRADAGDTLRLKMRLGNDPANGIYRPWREVLPDDLSTVDSGSSQWDWDEQTYPVAALEISLREAGDWDAHAELGASYSSIEQRAFQAAGAAVVSHPHLQLCRPQIGIPPTVVHADGNATGSVGGFTAIADDVFFVFIAELAAFPTTVCRWVQGVQAPDNGTFLERSITGDCSIAVYRIDNPKVGAGLVEASIGTGSVLLGVVQVRGYVSQVDVENIGSGTASSLAAVGGAGKLVIDAAYHASLGGGGAPGASPPTPGAGQTTACALNSQPNDQEFGVSYGADNPSWTFSGSMTWASLGVVVTGSAVSGDGPLVGTSPRAARCDHSHYLEDLPTTETDTTLVLRPDGSGGAEWVEPAEESEPFIPVTASDLTTYMQPHVDYDGHVVIDAVGNPVMVEVNF